MRYLDPIVSTKPAVVAASDSTVDPSDTVLPAGAAEDVWTDDSSLLETEDAEPDDEPFSDAPEAGELPVTDDPAEDGDK